MDKELAGLLGMTELLRVMMGRGRGRRTLRLVIRVVRHEARAHRGTCRSRSTGLKWMLELGSILLSVVDPIGDTVLGGKVALVGLGRIVVFSHRVVEVLRRKEEKEKKQDTRGKNKGKKDKENKLKNKIRQKQKKRERKK
jgi:hypothetical protein